jgi:hypothetical protein
MGVLIGVCFGLFIAWIVAIWYRISDSFEDEDDERREECEYDGDGEADDADK